MTEAPAFGRWEPIETDRDAAGKFARFLGECEQQVGRFIVGELDHTDIVQAFTAHRRQAEEAMRERCAKVAEAAELYDGDHLLNSDPRATVATAIRSMEVE